MTTRLPYLCPACVHVDWTTGVIWRCAAYPNGIPADILEGADHRTPRGDEVSGIAFAPAKTPNVEVVLDTWEAMSR